MSRVWKRIAVIGVVGMLVLAACGGDDDDSATRSTTTTASAATSTTAASPLTGPLDVFAAASLTEAFTDEQTTLKTDAPDLDVTYNFAGSQALVTQIQQGAPADVFASADM